MGFSCNLFRKPIHWTWQSGQSLNPPHDHSWSPWPIWKHVETYHPNSYQWSSILIHNNSTWFWPFSLIKSHLKFSKSYKAPFKLNYIQTLYEIILNPCFHTHIYIYIYHIFPTWKFSIQIASHPTSSWLPGPSLRRDTFLPSTWTSRLHRKVTGGRAFAKQKRQQQNCWCWNIFVISNIYTNIYLYIYQHVLECDDVQCVIQI